MEQAEIIKHRSRFNIIKRLEQDKTLIKMHVLGRQYEGLTVVTGTRFQNNNPCFLIDPPNGFKKSVTGVEACRIYFEFTGSDNLIYSFKTSGNKILQNDISIKVPEVIHRLQRRKNFRIAPPLGTKLYFSLDTQTEATSVINVSRGGVLAAINRNVQELRTTSLLTVGKKLTHVEMVFPSDGKPLDVRIVEAVVKRLEKNPVGDRDRCAIQFTDIKKCQEKKLIELIYEFQRDYLRKKMLNE